MLLPLCLALFTFAPAILRLWLGPAFADNAGTALRILSLGVFFGGLAHLPMALLYGSGRPDIPAKINLYEVIVYVPVTILLVRTFGITGAAAAWAIRCTADLTLYEIASRRALGTCSDDVLEQQRTSRLVRAALWLAVVFGISAWAGNVSASLALAVVVAGFAVYAAVGWAYVLAPVERGAWIGLILKRRARA
jgi:O-antigen/teichoic acid export membrane protein